MSHETIISNTSYFSQMLPVLNEKRQSGKFCDLIIKIEDHTLPAHGIILSACSNYLKDLIEGYFVDADTTTTIELNNLGVEIFESILTYFYTGSLTLTANTVNEVLEAADTLQLAWIKEQCFTFIQDLLNLKNALQIWNLAHGKGGKQLEYEAKKIVLKFLSEIIETEEFLELSLNQVKALLQDDEMVTRSDSIYEAIIKWVKHELPVRKSHLIDLLQNLNIEKINEPYFNTAIAAEPLLQENPDLKNWILKNAGIVKCFEKLDEFEEVIPERPKGKIFVCNLYEYHEFYSFDIETSILSCLTERETYDHHFYPVHYKGSIYMTGGDVIKRYDIANNQWSDFQFGCEASSHNACVLNDKMYLVGGYYLSSVNEYDFHTGKVITHSYMNMERQMPGLAVHGQTIYACGAYTGHRETGLGRSEVISVERCDMREGKWEYIPERVHEDGHCTSAVIGDDLYCAEVNPITENASIAKFDIRRNAWELIPQCDAWYRCFVAVNNELYFAFHGGIVHFKNKSEWVDVCPVSCEEPVALSLEC